MCQCQSLSIHLDGQSFETVSKGFSMYQSILLMLLITDGYQDVKHAANDQCK